MQSAGSGSGDGQACGGLAAHAGDEHGNKDGNAEGGAHILEHVEGTGSGGGLGGCYAGQSHLHEDGGVAAQTKTHEEQGAAHLQDAGVLIDQQHDGRAEGNKQKRDSGNDFGLLLIGHGAKNDGADGHAQVFDRHCHAGHRSLVNRITIADDLGQAGGHQTLGKEQNDDRENKILAGNELTTEDGTGRLFLYGNQNQ